MANQFVNLPVPTSNAAGAAVDVSRMGATKTITVGGPFQGTVTIEYATDDTGTLWAPVPNGSFVNNPGRVTIDVAAHWMRAVMENFKGGAANADVGSSGAGAAFVQLGPTSVDVSALPRLKTVVVSGACNVEISEDGVTWSQAFSFQNKGGQTGIVYAQFARVTNGVTAWMGGAEEGDGSGSQPFDGTVHTIYARMTGSDTSGNGTLANPYRTLQRAVLDVPSIIAPGAAWVVDISGVGGVVFDELLPPNYILPVWKAPQDFGREEGDPYFRITHTAVAIQATPQIVSTLTPAEATIEAVDVLSTSQDPLTKLWTITLNVARPSWGTSSPGTIGSGLKGKFAVGPDTLDRTHPIIGENTPSTILITTPTAPTYPIRIMEPSAWLHASGSFETFSTICAFNIDSMAFNGIKITSDDGNGGLFSAGFGGLSVQLCELESAFIESNTDYQAKILTNWFYGFPGFQSLAVQVNSAVFDNIVSGPFFLFGPPPMQPSISQSVFDNADGGISYGVFVPFQGAPQHATVSLMSVTNCIVRGSGDAGITAHGGNTLVKNSDIYGSAGPAIVANFGSGFVEVINCGSSGGANGAAGDPGILVDDGMHVRVDADTVAGGTALTPIQGGAVGQDMKVGVLPFRTWVNFGTIAPIGNEFDLVGMNAGATDQSTGSRLFLK